MSLLDAHGSAAAPDRRKAARPKLRYRQVIDLIEDLIAARDLQPGSLLPTQKELSEMAGVSLITVRRALDELERAGRVTGHQGVGTFVAHPRIVSEPALRGGLLATLAGRGAPGDISTDVLEVRAVEPAAPVRSALGLPGGARVWRISRLRRLDGRPMVLEQAHVPETLAPGLDGWRPEAGDSLYGMLARRFALVDDYEEQYLEVGDAHARERKLLHLPPRAQIVRLSGVSYADGDVPFDCFEQVYPATAFAFYISGRTSRRLVPAGELLTWQDAAGAEAAP